jgi:putative DNA primase/helicase
MADDDDVFGPKDPKARLIQLNEERQKRRQQQRQRLLEAPTEDQLAIDLGTVLAGRFKFVEAWGWLHHTGVYWEREQTRLVVDLARQLCRQAAQLYEMRKLAAFTTVRSVVELVKADRRIAATTAAWDLNPWLLNTPGGTVDLKNRVTYAHRADDFITKCTTASPGGDCPKWRAHWELVIPDVERRKFLRRYLGYALTGVLADCFLFAHGTGRNGRSTILNAVLEVLGTYGGSAQSSTFARKQYEAHSTELARLKSLRLVVTSENTRGARWNEERIKQITGGDRITARFMRRDDFEFVPEFKLIVSGNNKPDLDSVDEAMRARLLLLPFDVTIPKDDRRPNYFEELRAEAGGILEDLIQGNYEWQENGLKRPRVVVDATAEFMDSRDRISRWLADCCLVPKPGSAAAKGVEAEVMDLFKSWQRWSERTGERPGTMVAFVEALKATGKFGHSPNKSGVKARFHGLCLTKEEVKANQRVEGV